MAGKKMQTKDKVHQNDTTSHILWYSDWLHNTISAGSSIFLANHNTFSAYQNHTTREYEKWYMMNLIGLVQIKGMFVNNKKILIKNSWI